MMQMEGSDNDYSRGDKWRLACVEGKGMGVIATADIKQGELSLLISLNIPLSPRGELILTDRPLFIVPDSAHTDNPEDLNRVLSSEVEDLTQGDREYFFSLADCKVMKCSLLKTISGS